MKIRRKQVFLIILVIVLLLIGRYLIFSFSLNSLKAVLVEELEWATGMDITIDGDIRGRLLPGFAIVIDGVELEYLGFLNIRSRKLELEMPITSMFSSAVLLRGIRINDPKVVWINKSVDSSIPASGPGRTEPLTEEDDTLRWGIDLVDVNVVNGTFSYYDENNQDTIECSGLYLTSDSVLFKGAADTLKFEDVSAHGKLSISAARINSLQLDNIILNVDISRGVLDISHHSEGQHGEFMMDLSSKVPVFEIRQEIDSLNIAGVLRSYENTPSVKGIMNFSLEIRTSGTSASERWLNSNGKMILEGKDLVLYGSDIDKIAEKFKRSQKFNIVDISAMFLAGPVGLAVTKGGDYARLLMSKRGDSTAIREFISSWTLNAAELSVHDVAFSTNKNRIALKGAVNLWQQTFNEIEFALVNDNGCAVFSQSIKGRFMDPEVSDVKVVKTLLGPLKNIFKGNKCSNPFYSGSVKVAGNE